MSEKNRRKVLKAFATIKDDALKKSMLTLAVIALIGLGGPALAQDTETLDKDIVGHVVGKAIEALQCRKAERTDRLSRNGWPKARTIGKGN